MHTKTTAQPITQQTLRPAQGRRDSPYLHAFLVIEPVELLVTEPVEAHRQ